MVPNEELKTPNVEPSTLLFIITPLDYNVKAVLNNNQ